VEHWDVMLESASALTTWSIPPQSPNSSFFACPATRLPDHRKHYLDYEGEIGGNRGKVFRVDTGVYEQLSPNQIFVQGAIFSGVLTVENDKMSFEPLTDH
jgi:hypothetical protein